MSNLVLYSIPAFLALLALELAWTRRHPEAMGGSYYEPRDTLASLSMGVLYLIVGAAARSLALPFYALVYEHRIADVAALPAAAAWPLLLVTEDLCYYWFHRAHHEVRFLWAIHVNHHSSRRYNLSTALRQAILTPVSGPIFWAPLALIGFPPWMIFTAKAWSLLYQFWLHTEAIDRLGPLELVLNTPSHHRVHHGKNPRYLDRNHGGIFIVWDRLFGTFAPEEERVVYGLTKDIATFNPLRIAFHELAAIGRDVARAPTLRAKLGYVLQPPGWSHDGSSQTSAQLRRRSARG